MIMIFSHAHPSVSKGGAEVSAYTLYLGLRRLGMRTAFIAMCAEKDLPRLNFETPDEHVISYQPEQYDHFFHHAEPAVFDKIKATGDLLKPTALVFHHFLFLGINTLRRVREHFKCPSLLVIHEFLAICHHHGQMVTRPSKRLCSASSPARCGKCFPENNPGEFHARKITFMTVISGFDYLVSPSHFLAARFVDWGVASTKIRVVENGLAGYQPAADEQPMGGSGATVRSGAIFKSRHVPAQRARRHVFGYFGQINPFKGVDLILDAVEAIADYPEESRRIVVRAHGNIVGVSEAFQKRFDGAVAAGLIEYAGAYENTDVLRLMAACDYLVMASKWWENSPVVIQEAFAAQRPVIVPAIGGMAEKVVDGISGHHFAFDDPQDLARVFLKCVAEPEPNGDPHVFPRPSTAEGMARNYLNILKTNVAKI